MSKIFHILVVIHQIFILEPSSLALYINVVATSLLYLAFANGQDDIIMAYKSSSNVVSLA